jgi:ubiquinone/menaquinone biosynthesis C-methylase UbiE
MTKPKEGKIILDLCGGTGSWSRPYKEAGYDVRNITLHARDC